MEFTVVCPDCGEVVFSSPVEYQQENPNACDMAVEQAFDRHHSGECSYSSEYDHVVVCPDCGEVVYQATVEYWVNNPNGAEIGLSQAWDEHDMACPAGAYAQAWAAWRTETGAGDLSPRQWAVKAMRAGLPIKEIGKLVPPDRREEFLPRYAALRQGWGEEVSELAVKVFATLAGEKFPETLTDVHYRRLAANGISI